MEEESAQMAGTEANPSGQFIVVADGVVVDEVQSPSDLLR